MASSIRRDRLNVNQPSQHGDISLGNHKYLRVPLCAFVAHDLPESGLIA